MKKIMFLSVFLCLLFSARQANAQCTGYSWGAYCSVRSTSPSSYAWYDTYFYISTGIPLTVSTHVLPDVYNGSGAGGFEVDMDNSMWFDNSTWGLEHYGNKSFSAGENTDGRIYTYLEANNAFSSVTLNW